MILILSCRNRQCFREIVKLAKNSCLGLHYNEMGITAVLVEKQGAEFAVPESFRVVPEATTGEGLSTEGRSGFSAAEDGGSSLVELFGQETERRDLKSSGVVLSFSMMETRGL